VLGTQTFGAACHFAAEAPIAETTRATFTLGSNTIKFELELSAGSGR
jgi:hypothetical protein